LSFVVVNADDFGLTAGVAQGIILCSESGILLSTSAMTCVEGSQAILERDARQFAGGIGLHLQLTQGTPICPAGEVPSLVTANGHFPDRRPAVSVQAADIAREWRAQMNRLRELGIVPDHLDTHHNVHARPLGDGKILREYAALAAEFNLPARSGPRCVAGALRDNGVACPDVLISFSEAQGDLDALVAALDTEREAAGDDLLVEICCHPGLYDLALEARTLPRYGRLREKELAAFVRGEFVKRLQEEGWTIIEYRDVKRLRGQL
jgi:predicted glycoside hydrolase/deacetylase ChbG (UPF0249 family)